MGYQVDVHSHLLPGIDDGVTSWEESLTILQQLADWGFESVITTPHILSEYYPNSPETILPLLDELRTRATDAGLNLTLEAAAEYYVDEQFMDMLASKSPLLSFGPENMVLFETGFMNEPRFLSEAVFQLAAQGYKPVMAHPERYAYFHEDPDRIGFYAGRVLFQINTLSLIGYYNPMSKKIAQRMHRAELIHFLGSDLHRPRQLEAMKDALGSSLARKIQQAGIQNAKLV